MVPDTNNPQAFNRYSYVLNNPINRNDPTGHYWSNPLNLLRGMGIAIYNTAKSVEQMVVNPVQTYQNLSHAVNNPGDTLNSIASSYSAKWSTEEGHGELLGEFATTLFTASPAFKAGDVAKITSKTSGISAVEDTANNSGMAFRYVTEGEFQAIQDNGGIIPNIDAMGNPRNIFVTPNKFNTVAEAEESLQIGSKNPLGKFESPKYGVAFEQNSVTYNYAGNVEGGNAIEMTTRQEIPSLSWWYLY